MSMNLGNLHSMSVAELKTKRQTIALQSTDAIENYPELAPQLKLLEKQIDSELASRGAGSSQNSSGDQFNIKVLELQVKKSNIIRERDKALKTNPDLKSQYETTLANINEEIENAKSTSSSNQTQLTTLLKLFLGNAN